MSARKPPTMPIQTWVDHLVEDARRRGEFDNLPGKGKPIEGLDKPYDPDWWIKQWMEREEISLTPATLATRRNVEKLFDSLGRVPTEAAVHRKVDALNEQIRRVNRAVHVDAPPSTVAPLDIVDVLARWREARTGNRIAWTAKPAIRTAPAPTTADRTVRWWPWIALAGAGTFAAGAVLVWRLSA